VSKCICVHSEARDADVIGPERLAYRAATHINRLSVFLCQRPVSEMETLPLFHQRRYTYSGNILGAISIMLAAVRISCRLILTKVLCHSSIHLERVKSVDNPPLSINHTIRRITS
jgi:hypothetical protein